MTNGPTNPPMTTEDTLRAALESAKDYIARVQEYARLLNRPSPGEPGPMEVGAASTIAIIDAALAAEPRCSGEAVMPAGASFAWHSEEHGPDSICGGCKNHIGWHMEQCGCKERPWCVPHPSEGIHQWRSMCRLPHEHAAPTPPPADESAERLREFALLADRWDAESVSAMADGLAEQSVAMVWCVNDLRRVIAAARKEGPR